MPPGQQCSDKPMIYYFACIRNEFQPKIPTELYQHHMFWGTYRMPGETRDDLLLGYVRDPPARHVVVARNGQVHTGCGVAGRGGGGFKRVHDSIKPPVWSRRFVAKFV